MIDWRNLAANSLWILGCALALSTFSYASWEASIHKQKLRVRLGRPAVQLAFNLAGLLFCAGLAATAGSIIETVLWGLLSVLFAAQVFATARHLKNSSE